MKNNKIIPIQAYINLTKCHVRSDLANIINKYDMDNLGIELAAKITQLIETIDKGNRNARKSTSRLPN